MNETLTGSELSALPIRVFNKISLSSNVTTFLISKRCEIFHVSYNCRLVTLRMGSVRSYKSGWRDRTGTVYPPGLYPRLSVRILSLKHFDVKHDKRQDILPACPQETYCPPGSLFGGWVGGDRGREGGGTSNLAGKRGRVSCTVRGDRREG